MSKMARMSRKELEKRVMELENAVRALSQMHDISFSELAAYQKYINKTTHPKVNPYTNPVKTSYGWVGLEELTKFVVDGEPLKFKMEDKELVKEVHPDGSVLEVVKDKEKKTLYMAPKTVPYYGPRKDDKSGEYLRQIDSMYARIKKEYGW